MIPPEPASIQFPAARESTRVGTTIQAVESEGSVVRLGLEIPQSVASGRLRAGFNITLPEQTSVTTRVVRYGVGERVLWDLADEDASTTEPLAMGETRAADVIAKGYLRQYPIYRLTLKDTLLVPFRNLPSNERNRIYVVLELSWKASDGDNEAVAASEPTAATEPVNGAELPKRGMKALAHHLVANPGDLERFASENPGKIKQLAPKPHDPRQMAPDARGWASVKVSRAGLCRISGASLVEAGILATDESLDTVRVFSQGQAVSLLRANDSIYFYGWGGESPYSTERVYWVTASGQAPEAPMAAIDNSLVDREPQPLDQLLRRYRMENDKKLLVEHGNFLSFVGAYWVDRKMLESRTFGLPIRLFSPRPLLGGQSVPLRLKFYTYGNPKQWIGTEVALKNGNTKIATLRFTESPDELLQTVQVPTELIKNGLISLKLEVQKTSPSTADKDANAGVWLDWVELEYPSQIALERGLLVFDEASVTSPGLYQLAGLSGPEGAKSAPWVNLALNKVSRDVRLLQPVGETSLGLREQGWTSEVVDLATLKATALEPVYWDDSALDFSTPADYLIITHSAFRDQLGPLLDLNAERGLATRVVDIEDLYKFFSDGTLSPKAIHDYLAYTASEAGSLAPSYVLLVGDCTSDYKDDTRSGVKNWVPTYSYRSGEDTWASDIWHALVVGTDNLPDYLLGRFSVNNADDLKAQIEKTILYAQKPVFGPWRARMGYVADNFEQFRRTAETVRKKSTPAAFNARLVYLDQMTLEDNWYYPKDELERIWAEERTMMKVSGQTTRAIKDTFDQGVAWLDFYGHGAPNLWTDERIWFGGDSPNRDAQHLTPNGRFAFICNFTCNTGAIDYPMPQWNICISEDMMRVKDGGAVGMFVPSGPGRTTLHEKLSSHLRRALFKDDLRGFGEVTTMARLRYILDDNTQSLMRMYNLLGDPASQVAIPRRWGSLDLDREVAMPGRDTVSASMDGIWPPVGQASAWLEDEDGRVVWTKDAMTYQDGHIGFDCPLPADFPSPGTGKLYLYAWNEQVGRDFVATATVRVARPEVRIRQARAMRSPENAGLVHFELALENSGAVDADSVALGLTMRMGDQKKQLDERSVSVSVGQSHTEQFDLDLGVGPDLTLFDWEVRLPVDPDSTQLANPQRQAFALAGQEAWTGIVPALSSWEVARPQLPNGRINLTCLSSGPDSRQQYIQWRTAAGDASSSVSLSYKPMGDAGMAVVNFTPPAFRQSGGEDNTLELVGVDEADGTTRSLQTLTLGEIPRRDPRLRIRRGSIQNQPEFPTDGETIFVSFIVENAGQATSAPTSALLQSEASPNGRGATLSVQTNIQDNRVKALAPGRSLPMRLRWDPVKNDGVQNIYINLNPRKDRPEDVIKEQLIGHRIYVKTKSHLVRTRAPWSSASEEDRLGDRIWLHAEVENKGETDAHDVLVSFYLDKSRTDDKLIGRMEVDRIPAKSRREVKLKWNYDREKVFVGGKFNVRPVVDIRLKGSSQRIAE